MRRKKTLTEEELFYLWAEENGNLSKVARHEGSPTRETLRKLRDTKGWEERKKRLDERWTQIAQPEHETKERIKRLKLIEEMLYSSLLPQKNPKTGELEYILRPSNFEQSVDKLIKVIEKIEFMRGAPTSRVEIRHIVDVNIKSVLRVFGMIINNMMHDGVLNAEQAREFLKRVDSGTKELDYQLSSDA